MMQERISDLSRLPNIGPITEQWLNELGIYNKEQLQELGAVEVYRQIRLSGANASLNLLYALHGALNNTPWHLLSAATREQLKRQVGMLTEAPAARQ
jgi:DNA transformation protein